MSSSVISSLANGTGWRKFGDATSVPSRIRVVAHAAAVRVGIAPNHDRSRNERQARWSYVHAWSSPSCSARRHTACALDHRCSGRMTTPRRTRRSAVDEELAVGRVLGRTRFLGQSKDTLADDVALYLVGAAVDRCPGREQRDLLHEAGTGRVLPEDHAVGADDLVADLTLQPKQVAHHELRDVGFGTGALAR